MNAHVQRLLSRVAPPPAAAPTAMPVASIGSPIAEGDQRIGMPGFDGLFDATDVTPAGDGEGAIATKPAARAAPAPTVSTTIVAPVQAPATAVPTPSAAGPSPGVATPVASDTAALSDTIPSTEIPAVATPPWQPPFAIDVRDFDPAPPPAVEEADPVEQAEVDRASLAEPVPVADRIADATPVRAPLALVPSPAEPAPARRAAPVAEPIARPAPLAEAIALPRGAVAEAIPVPATASPAMAEAAPAAAEARSRPVVIEEVVIEVIPPPPSPRPQTMNAEAARAPSTAAAASVIGPLPVRRSRTMLFGMRRG